MEYRTPVFSSSPEMREMINAITIGVTIGDIRTKLEYCPELVHYMDFRNETLLMIAADSRRYDVAMFLVMMGSNIEWRGNKGTVIFRLVTHEPTFDNSQLCDMVVKRSPYPGVIEEPSAMYNCTLLKMCDKYDRGDVKGYLIDRMRTIRSNRQKHH